MKEEFFYLQEKREKNKDKNLGIGWSSIAVFDLTCMRCGKVGWVGCEFQMYIYIYILSIERTLSKESSFFFLPFKRKKQVIFFWFLQIDSFIFLTSISLFLPVINHLVSYFTS